jgi:omega-6 fatty acid desaturase (delta-12 desaturase)
MTNDQVFVPHTRSARQLPPLDSQRENMEGSRVQLDVQHLYEEIIGDSPIIAFLSCVGRLVCGNFLRSKEPTLIVYAPSCLAGLSI